MTAQQSQAAKAVLSTLLGLIVIQLSLRAALLNRAGLPRQSFEYTAGTDKFACSSAQQSQAAKAVLSTLPALIQLSLRAALLNRAGLLRQSFEYIAGTDTVKFACSFAQQSWAAKAEF